MPLKALTASSAELLPFDLVPLEQRDKGYALRVLCSLRCPSLGITAKEMPNGEVTTSKRYSLLSTAQQCVVSSTA
jgi:hypothetical protein